MTERAATSVLSAGEAKMAEALRPFGWTCTPAFWQRYYSDPWVFSLANAVERLTDELATPDNTDSSVSS